MGISEISLVTIENKENPIFGLLYIPDKNLSQLVVLAHGYGGSKQDMASLGQKLCDKGSFVFTPDLRGHKLGRTGGRLDSIDHVSEDLEKCVHFAKQQTNAKRVIIAGHSFSGGASSKTAAVCPDVDALILLGIALRPLNENFSHLTAMSNIMNKMVDGLPSVEMSNQSQRTLRKHISKVFPKPILVVLGTKDKINSEQRGKDLLERIDGPKTLKFVNSDHFKVPQVCSGVVLKWLKQISWPE